MKQSPFQGLIFLILNSCHSIAFLLFFFENNSFPCSYFFINTFPISFYILFSYSSWPSSFISFFSYSPTTFHLPILILMQTHAILISINKRIILYPFMSIDNGPLDHLLFRIYFHLLYFHNSFLLVGVFSLIIFSQFPQFSRSLFSDYIFTIPSINNNSEHLIITGATGSYN